MSHHMKKLTRTAMESTISLHRLLLGFSLLVVAGIMWIPVPSRAQVNFFSESFDDTNFAGRGWYDGTGGQIDSSNHITGSIASFNCHWIRGGTDCAGGTPHRHLFTASPTVYVSFWMKLGSATVQWQGSGVPYHPHLVQLLTDADNAYIGPNSSLFSALIETSLFKPRIAEADSMAVNVPQAGPTPGAGPNLLTSATPHAVAGCNGNQNSSSSCYACAPPNYPSVGAYCNSTYWDAASPAFINNQWHHVEFYAAMNSTSAGIAHPDGIFKYWVDGNLVINYTNVYLRSGDNPNRKFNQLLLAPYIGVGSPVAQDLWIDNLVVTDQPSSLPGNIPAPTNLRVIQ